jgi:hypothetical protein
MIASNHHPVQARKVHPEHQPPAGIAHPICQIILTYLVFMYYMHVGYQITGEGRRINNGSFRDPDNGRNSNLGTSSLTDNPGTKIINNKK